MLTNQQWATIVAQHSPQERIGRLMLAWNALSHPHGSWEHILGSPGDGVLEILKKRSLAYSQGHFSSWQETAREALSKSSVLRENAADPWLGGYEPNPFVAQALWQILRGWGVFQGQTTIYCPTFGYGVWRATMPGDIGDTRWIARGYPAALWPRIQEEWIDVRPLDGMVQHLADLVIASVTERPTLVASLGKGNRATGTTAAERIISYTLPRLVPGGIGVYLLPTRFLDDPRFLNSRMDVFEAMDPLLVARIPGPFANTNQWDDNLIDVCILRKRPTTGKLQNYPAAKQAFLREDPTMGHRNGKPTEVLTGEEIGWSRQQAMDFLAFVGQESATVWGEQRRLSRLFVVRTTGRLVLPSSSDGTMPGIHQAVADKLITFGESIEYRHEIEPRQGRSQGVLVLPSNMRTDRRTYFIQIARRWYRRYFDPAEPDAIRPVDDPEVIERLPVFVSMKNLMDAVRTAGSAPEANEAIRLLKNQYDGFVTRFGPLHDDRNRQMLNADLGYRFLLDCEEVVKVGRETRYRWNEAYGSSVVTRLADTTSSLADEMLLGTPDPGGSAPPTLRQLYRDAVHAALGGQIFQMASEATQGLDVTGVNDVGAQALLGLAYVQPLAAAIEEIV